MRIFVTGANGFVGRAFCEVALGRGHEVLGLCRNADARLPEGCQVARGSLASMPWQEVECFGPDAALHLAWLTTPGVYLHAAENETLAHQSKALFRGLSERGVRHLAGTGTCIEYAASAEPLHETSPLAPQFAYSKAKQLCSWLEDFCTSGLQLWTWFRIFYPYGPGEHPDRLPSHLVSRLRGGKVVELRTPASVKDYVFITDLAEALCIGIEASVTGPVNLGSGRGVSIQQLAEGIADLLGADPQGVGSAMPPQPDPTPHVVADISKILQTGWTPRTSLRQGLERLVSSMFL